MRIIELIKIDSKGQISAELILILGSMSVIVLITAYYITNMLEEITEHSKIVIINMRNEILGDL